MLNTEFHSTIALMIDFHSLRSFLPASIPLDPLRETPLNPNLTATDAITNLRDVSYHSFILPKRTLRTFNGNPLDYHRFIKSFNATIREQATEPASQLEYLIDMCTGKAREVIKHLSSVTPPSLGMNQAMETLHIRFGQKHIVVKAHLDSITDGHYRKISCLGEHNTQRTSTP